MKDMKTGINSLLLQEFMSSNLMYFESFPPILPIASLNVTGNYWNREDQSEHTWPPIISGLTWEPRKIT